MARQLREIQTREAARILAVTPTRVGQLVKEGSLKVSARLGDGTPLFDPQEVEGLKQRRITQLIQKVKTLRST
jgi:hypothetical protein